MNRPLTGIRVTGLEQYMAGPYCTLLLADAGAEVIKIERPGKGDPRRSIPPFVEKGGIKQAAGFMGYNRNKKSLALDIAAPKARNLQRLVAPPTSLSKTCGRPRWTAGLGFDDMRKTQPPPDLGSTSRAAPHADFKGPYSDRRLRHRRDAMSA